MSNISKLEALYLDDKIKNLKMASDFFIKKGCNLTTSNSVEDAMNRIERERPKIFLCDLDLKEINSPKDGFSILMETRKKNKDIFLALYTAYANDLSLSQKASCKANDIEIYDNKAEDELFLLNLNSDFNKFISSKNKQNLEKPYQKSYFILGRELVIHHLRNISNQNAKIYWYNNQHISVKDLIKDVENESDIGIEYMQEWLETVSYLEELKK